MSFSQRAKTLSEVSEHILHGADAGYEVKDFLHEFQVRRHIQMLDQPPVKLEGQLPKGQLYDAFLQALAVYLASRINHDPPAWTRPAIQLPKPWFASPGVAIRNYLLISSPSPFRMRNIFVDEDSLTVV
jgi:hypothetical protein